MRARDVMTAPVLTVRPDTKIADIARLLIDKHISAAPVVDDAGYIVGIVSEGDLLRRAEIGTEKRRPWWLEMLTSPDLLANEYVKSHGLVASEIMTKEVVTVKEDTPIQEIADLLEAHRIKRVPVVKRRKVVGIVSRANLLQGLAVHGSPKPGRTAETDQSLRDAVMKTINRQPWAGGAVYNVLVTKRVVHLWGFVRSTEERQAMIVAAENVPGVKDVEDHLSIAHHATGI
ncbi:MAG: CBS domain-containing protein [Alphaproteobacteria bacterium]|nr:CBS domain-containing protein [Alphaproteobacteria bacterium]